jgi:hypothetical protein
MITEQGSNICVGCGTSCLTCTSPTDLADRTFLAKCITCAGLKVVTRADKTCGPDIQITSSDGSRVKFDETTNIFDIQFTTNIVSINGFKKFNWNVSKIKNIFLTDTLNNVFGVGARVKWNYNTQLLQVKASKPNVETDGSTVIKLNSVWVSLENCDATITQDDALPVTFVAAAPEKFILAISGASSIEGCTRMSLSL